MKYSVMLPGSFMCRCKTCNLIIDKDGEITEHKIDKNQVFFEFEVEDEYTYCFYPNGKSKYFNVHAEFKNSKNKVEKSYLVPKKIDEKS